MKIPNTDPNAYPWDHPGMIVCEGREFHGFVSLAIKSLVEPKRGADITGLLWRYQDKPADWIFTSRVRIYAGANNDAWDGQDRKRWYAQKLERCTGPEAAARVDGILQGCALTLFAVGIATKPPDWFLIEGDIEKAFHALRDRPPEWMHRRAYSVDAKGRTTAVHTSGQQPPSQ